MVWLTSPTGTGKLTIVQTFAEMSLADGKLGASLLCSRNFDDRNNLRSIFPILAFRLAHRCSDFRQRLFPVLKANRDVGRESLTSQLEKLLAGPFRAAQIPTLIVIGALDGCWDEEPALRGGWCWVDNSDIVAGLDGLEGVRIDAGRTPSRCKFESRTPSQSRTLIDKQVFLLEHS